MAKTWVQSTGTTRDWAQDDFQESTAIPEPMLHPFSIGGQEDTETLRVGHSCLDQQDWKNASVK